MTNHATSAADAYVKQFWSELPEPMQNRLRMAYNAGLQDLRGQAAIAALQGLASRWNFVTSDAKADAAYNAKVAVAMADELIKELNG